MLQEMKEKRASVSLQNIITVGKTVCVSPDTFLVPAFFSNSHFIPCKYQAEELANIGENKTHIIMKELVMSKEAKGVKGL